MRGGLYAIIAAVAVAAVAAAAIVAVSTDQSSVPSPAGLPTPPAAAVLPFDWNDPSHPPPALTFTDRDGNPLTLADFAGRPVLVNLWATWCAPCLKEMPMLDALAAAVGDGLPVLALNQDRGGLAAAAPFWDEHGFRALRLMLDPGFAAGRAVNARGLPLTLLIGADGLEQGRLEGIARWDDPEVVAYFRALAGGG